MTENEHTEDSENFEEMLKESLARSDDFSVGDRVTGTVVSISNDLLFVDISGKSDAIMDSSEFMDDKGDLTVRVGDTVGAYIVSTRSGEIVLTEKIGLGRSNQDLLDIAFRNHIPVYGRVASTAKGGYTVTVSGASCFCPLSQIDAKSSKKPDEYIGAVLEFKITEFGGKGKNIVVSRRALLDEKKQKKEEDLKTNLNLGDEVHGIVASVQNFGLFIDIDGFQALVPKSEISWSRNTDINSFSLGDEVSAKVKAMDWDKKQLTLSIKDLSPEPWAEIGRFTIGDSVNGKVVNIIKTGAFVEIFPGLEGFIHLSNLSHVKQVNNPGDVVSRNDMVTVRIIDILPDKKKISLELMTGEPDPWQVSGDSLINSIHEATIEGVRSSGASARLSNGMLGFVPREELIRRKGTDLQAEYTVGSTIKVTVKRIDPESRKMILSEEGAFKKAERDEYEKYMTKGDDAGTSTLGSLFKDKFEKLQKDIKK